MNRPDIFAETAARMAYRQRRAAELDAQEKKLYKFRRPGGTIVVHAATRKPGTWQITRFDHDSTPIGHNEAPSRLIAITEAARWHGADLAEDLS